MIKQYDQAVLDAQSQFEAVWDAFRDSVLKSLAELEDLSKDFHAIGGDAAKTRVLEATDLVSVALDASLGKCSRLAQPFAATLEDLNAAVIKHLAEGVECTHLTVTDSSKRRSRPAQRLKIWLHRHLSYPVGTFGRCALDWTMRVKLAPSYIKTLPVNLISLVRNASGPPATPQEALLAVTELPSRAELDVRLRGFPTLYRRLFSLHPLEIRELLIGGDAELQNMTEAYQLFLAGAPVNLAVIGSKGSGKTSLLNCFVEETVLSAPLRRSAITRRLRTESEFIGFIDGCFQFNETSSSVSELISRLQRLPKQIVILEGGDNLFIKTIGARGAAEAFLQVMMSTRENLMWCVSFQDHPWLQMDHVLHISRYFTYEIRAGLNNSQKLQDALLLRLSHSGLNAVFLQDDPVSLDGANQLAKGDTLLAQEEDGEIRENYFRGLFRINGGSFLVTTFNYIETSNELRISPCVKIDNRIMQSLERVYLFTVAELLKHGGLTLEEHSELFNMDTRDSQLILVYLSQLPLVPPVTIEPGCSGERYEVNPIYHHHTSSYLSSLNILH